MREFVTLQHSLGQNHVAGWPYPHFTVDQEEAPPIRVSMCTSDSWRSHQTCVINLLDLYSKKRHTTQGTAEDSGDS